VEHRQNTEEHVVYLPGQVVVHADHHRRRDEVPMRQDHAFAQPRGPRGVQQRRRVPLLNAALRKLRHRPRHLHHRFQTRDFP